MSHYISATIDGENIEFTSGTNHRTISAAADSGFDIYYLYNAFEYNNGMSGSGESAFVNHEIATNAYKNAIAWALALKHSYHAVFEQELAEILKYDKQFLKLIINDVFNKEELEILINDKLELQELMSEDEVSLSIGLLAPILEFSYAIYKGTKNGHEVEISFC